MSERIVDPGNPGKAEVATAADQTPAASKDASDDKAGPSPVEAEPLVFTVRRPVAKIGRNDPCHCGSGKKYKKCCVESDRARLADPSPWAGLTMEEARRDPTRHGDPTIFLEMSRAELDATPRGSLTPPLLLGLSAAYAEKALFPEALAVLELLALVDEGAEARESLVAARGRLVYSALAQGDAAFARETLARHPPPTEDYEGILNRLSVDLACDELPPLLGRIEGFLRDVLDAGFELTDLADAVALGGLSGLSIIIARAAASLRGPQADREVLAEILQSERAALGLDEQDPARWLLAQAGRPMVKRGAQAELEQMAERLRQRDAAIQKMVSERDRLAGELGKRAIAEAASADPAATESEEARRLRRKVEALQAELREKQKERQDLQHQLRASASEVDAGKGHPEGARARTRGEAAPLVDEELGEAVPDEAAAVLAPVRFSELFYESAAALDDRRVALRAQEAAARFGALDPATWKQAKKMNDLQGVFTLRVGIHHRVFVVRRDSEVEVRELVTREAFDRTLKRYRK